MVDRFELNSGAATRYKLQRCAASSLKFCLISAFFCSLDCSVVVVVSQRPDTFPAGTHLQQACLGAAHPDHHRVAVSPCMAIPRPWLPACIPAGDSPVRTFTDINVELHQILLSPTCLQAKLHPGPRRTRGLRALCWRHGAISCVLPVLQP